MIVEVIVRDSEYSCGLFSRQDSSLHLGDDGGRLAQVQSVGLRRGERHALHLRGSNVESSCSALQLADFSLSCTDLAVLPIETELSLRHRDTVVPLKSYRSTPVRSHPSLYHHYHADVYGASSRSVLNTETRRNGTDSPVEEGVRLAG